MIHNRIITENSLDEWVRGHSRDAQGVIVELVYRLVAASSPRPKYRHFPLGDSIEQPGPDGELDTEFGFDPFFPESRSFWEIGTGLNARRKATEDYNKLVQTIPEDVRHQATFIFVTPLSGRRDWADTWKEDGISNWLQERRQRNDWRDVHVHNGTHLVDWMGHFPAVETWLAIKTGLHAHQIQTPEQRWDELRTIGAPPPLTPDIFLANRGEAFEKLKEVFTRTMPQLKLDTHFPDQVVDFVTACIAAMDEDERIDAVGRCLIISGADAWNEITALPERHILVADFDLDETEGSATRFLEKALRRNHAAIYGGMPGGIPHPNRASLPNPRGHQVKEALEKAGYKEERARVLAQKCDGNLSSLLRCLQNLSLHPDWARDTYAADLVVAELIGSWNENSEADRAIIESLSGKAYGEWIGRIREVAFSPGTPLSQRDGVWKVVVRYEGWYALGPRLFDEHLDRLRQVTVAVLRETHPKLELPPEERYAASIYGKVMAHSNSLRRGLAESLAILGSHPNALASCSVGKAEETAVLAVRDVLEDADWVLWASLNGLLPLLAEAAPGEFLDAIEEALNRDPCPFDTLFSQESTGITGENYMSGLLWGLETLAWDEEYFTRVIVILGELSARDPGGNWANRPANSLSTILLPWLPQTCAPIHKRKTAVEILTRDLPDVAWSLLLGLLPGLHQWSSYTRKPTWREMIPDDWSSHVTLQQYWEQIDIYAELAIAAAKKDMSKLAALIDRLQNLPPSAYEQVLAHLRSDVIMSLPQDDRYFLWTQLENLVSNHREFADAEWAMKPEQIDHIAAIAEQLAPEASSYRHRRLFEEQDSHLFEGTGDYEQQIRELEERRQTAIGEIFISGGIEAVLEFATTVEAPRRVGFAFGMVAENDTDRAILPRLLFAENERLAQFAGGFIWGRFRAREWRWVDSVDTSDWTPEEKGLFLAYLPFVPETWERSTRLLREDESPYWTETTPYPFETVKGLERAADRLVKYGRPHAAIACLYRLLHAKQPLNPQQVVRTLLSGLDSSEIPHTIDPYRIIDIIKALQDDPHANPDDVLKIEWAYLPLLNRHRGTYPKFLEQRLSDDPDFFCEVIRLVFQSKHEDSPAEPSESERAIAENGYELLHRWRTPPGTRKDGSFDGESLAGWLKRVKAACAESGHLEIAMTMVGHVLFYVPPDPDGLWIHHSAAAALNERDADDMRDGFRSELFNSRGGFGFTAGRAERELAEKYRARADTVDQHGYHRLATTLRKLAKWYEQDAEREASRDPYGD